MNKKVSYVIAFVISTLLIINSFKPSSALRQQSVSPTSPVQAFVLIGQSNMVGHSTIPTVQQASNNAFNWDNGKWVVALAPLFLTGEYSPANQFLISLVSVGILNVGTIPCAKDSSTVQEWQKGEPLYEDCLFMIKQAILSGAEINGILVSQGEANTSSKELADSWIPLWENSLYNLMTDYGDLEHSTGVIFAQLGYDPLTTRNTHWQYLHDIQTKILLNNPTFKMIVTDDLGKKPDNIHFTTTSNKIIGQRFASAWCNIISYQQKK